METDFEQSLLKITANIVKAFVKNNEISQEGLRHLIKNLYADLYREIEQIAPISHKTQITSEVIEHLIEQIETEERYDQLADLDLRNILYLN